MLSTVVIIILVLGLCAVSLAAIASVVWMRKREQERDQVLQSADALATLDDALDDALKELNKVGNLVQKEISEKYQAMLFLYNLLEEKQKAQIILPENIKADLAKAETAAAVKPVVEIINKPQPPKKMLTVESIKNESAIESSLQEKQDVYVIEPEVVKPEPIVTEPDLVPVVDAEPVAAPEKKKKAPPKKTVEAKPAPRKRTANPKHEKVKEMDEKGLSVADIAKELGIGQGEIRLILEMTAKR